MQKSWQRHLVGQRTHNDMNLRAALNLLLFVSVALWLRVSGMPLDGAQSGQRTALPLLFLLNYPQVYAGGSILPGIPIRRPQDEPTVTQKPSQSTSMSQLADETPQRVQSSDPNALIREQFLQGILQGLQAESSNDASTVKPAVLADFLEQLNSVRTTEAPKISSATIEKDTQVAENSDADYDYIDFKNGSRIKYDLDNDQQSADDVEYPNKILANPQLVGYFKSQQHVI